MQKEEMIKSIYKKVADKTLTFGCKLGNGHLSYKGIFISLKKKPGCNGRFLFQIDNDGCSVPVIELDTLYDEQWITKIGHPVMIGDVLDYIDSIEFNHPNDFIKWHKEKYPIIMDTLFTDWEQKRKPIEEQSDDCITYIYNLIK